MTAVELIEKKKRGGALSREEIRFLLRGYVDGQIPDYQMSAFAMAVCFRGMEEDEVTDFTLEMAASGDQMDLSGLPGFTADKHSTGGVGDKTSLVVLPLAAACGLTVAKMSGRGLGHTGGTIDKLESIPGFTTSLTQEAFLAQAAQIRIALAGQTGHLVPADKKLYALRDVTGTVASIPLIASSIMSKKLAAGAQGIVLDVKVGDGAFMKTLPEAEELARTMVCIGKGAGRRVCALLTDMDQPLGRAVGNAVEVREAYETLRGAGPEDLAKLSVRIVAEQLRMAGRAESEAEAEETAREALASGRALEAFRRWIRAQGGDVEALQSADFGRRAPCRETVAAPRDGVLAGIACEQTGHAAMLLGAGRQKLGDIIDPEAGILFYRKAGEAVRKGEPVAELFASSPERLAAGRQALEPALHFADEAEALRPLLLGRIG